MTSIALDANNRKIIVGVDTHRYAYVAVAIDNLGTRLGEHHVPANREGYARLEAWAEECPAEWWGLRWLGVHHVVGPSA